MARFRLSKSFEQLGDQLQDALKEVRKKDNMKGLGTFMADLIRKRTRLGYGVEVTGGPRKPLDALNDKYKLLRAKLDLSSETTPGRSNLTRSGQLLDSIQVTSFKEGEVSVGPKGNRTDGGPTNEKLAEYVAEQGRPFNNLSGPEIKQVQQEAAKVVRDILEK